LGAPERRLTAAYAGVIKRTTGTGWAWKEPRRLRRGFSWPSLPSGQDPQASETREKIPRVTDGAPQPRRCGLRRERLVQYPRRRITRRVRRAVRLALRTPRRAVLLTLLAPRRTRRRAGPGTSTAACVQSVLTASRSASVRVESDAASDSGAASTEDAAAMMAGVTAKPPKRPTKNVRRSMRVPSRRFEYP
jgi:hypothetical protein